MSKDEKKIEEKRISYIVTNISENKDETNRVFLNDNKIAYFLVRESTNEKMYTKVTNGKIYTKVHRMF